MTGVSQLMEGFFFLHVFAKLFFVPFDPCVTAALFVVLSQTLQLSELPVHLLLSVSYLKTLGKATVTSYTRISGPNLI